MESKKEDQAPEEELGNYITQVVTDIGTSINQDIFNKFVQAPMKSKLDISGKRLRWKMASATNPYGIAPDEYSKFAIHVYKYLSYIKDLEIPDFEELVDAGKLVDIKRRTDNSKF